MHRAEDGTIPFEVDGMDDDPRSDEEEKREG